MVGGCGGVQNPPVGKLSGSFPLWENGPEGPAGSQRPTERRTKEAKGKAAHRVLTRNDNVTRLTSNLQHKVSFPQWTLSLAPGFQKVLMGFPQTGLLLTGEHNIAVGWVPTGGLSPN